MSRVSNLIWNFLNVLKMKFASTTETIICVALLTSRFLFKNPRYKIHFNGNFNYVVLSSFREFWPPVLVRLLTPCLLSHGSLNPLILSHDSTTSRLPRSFLCWNATPKYVLSRHCSHFLITIPPIWSLNLKLCMMTDFLRERCPLHTLCHLTEGAYSFPFVHLSSGSMWARERMQGHNNLKRVFIYCQHGKGHSLNTHPQLSL